MILFMYKGVHENLRLIRNTSISVENYIFIGCSIPTFDDGSLTLLKYHENTFSLTQRVTLRGPCVTR